MIRPASDSAFRPMFTARHPRRRAGRIAAHETGHAIQHAKAYAPLKARMAIVPMTMFASRMLPFVIIGGFFFHMTGLITLGIYCYAILFMCSSSLHCRWNMTRRAVLK